MRRLALLALVLVSCAKHPTSAVDAQLPEQATDVPDLSPRAVLEEGAANMDPTPRARALYWLIRDDPAPAGGAWASRALYDPSAWVQRAGVRGLSTRTEEPATRALLEEYVALGQADPYTRCTAGLLLAPRGSAAAAQSLAAAWRAEREPWVVAPLALASAALGDTEAVAAVGEALATGEIGLELDFLSEVGASGLPALQASLREGGQWVEEELALPYAVALVELGDPSGEQLLRKTLDHASAEIRLGVLDMLVELDHGTATALLERAKGDATDLVRWYARLALAARGAGDVDTFEKAWLDPDREVRLLAVRLVARAAADPVAGSNRKITKAAEHIVAAALTDDDAPIRLEGVLAAATLDSRAFAPAIAALSRDPWLHLRVEAAGSAQHLGYAAPANR